MARSNRATFRLPAVALFVPVLLFVCITPLATVDGAWWALYIVPVIAFGWVLITHTTATADRMTTFGLLGTRTMTWEELDQLELPDARWAIAVAQDGRRLRLPMVRPRDVPRLVAVSGGTLRLGDPAPDDPDEILPVQTGSASADSPSAEVAAENPAADNQATENPAEPAAETAASQQRPADVAGGEQPQPSADRQPAGTDPTASAHPRTDTDDPVTTGPALQVNPPR